MGEDGKQRVLTCNQSLSQVAAIQKQWSPSTGLTMLLAGTPYKNKKYNRKGGGGGLERGEGRWQV